MNEDIRKKLYQLRYKLTILGKNLKPEEIEEINKQIKDVKAQMTKKMLEDKREGRGKWKI